MKFCWMVDIHYVITYVNFGDDRLRGLAVARGQIMAFPIDIDRRPYLMRPYLSKGRNFNAKLVRYC